MKATSNANLAGVLFQIEEDAYQLLENYFYRIEVSFSNSANGNEIIKDLECRLKELFNERTQMGAKIVTIKDVYWAISILGRTEDFGGQKDGSNNETWQNSNYGYKSVRRLYRYSDNKIISGVCSGLGVYFDFDPVLLRVAFVIMFFLSLGPIVYFILWIALPKAKTVSQKLELHGLPPTPENIRRFS
jgi:phage shock protein PspC (stress-responsive transcriptional regulator)